MPSVRILKLADPQADRQLGTRPDAQAWRGALAAFAPAGTLKQEPRAGVQRGTLLGRDVVVKFMELDTIARKLTAAIGLSRPHRQWRGHQLLARLGVRTGQPLCLARADEPSARPQLILVLAYIPGKSLLQHLADNDLSIKAQHRLAEALGVQIGTIVAHRKQNRDHKLSNLIAVDSESDHPSIAVIDAVGVGSKLKRSRANVASRMLFSAIVEPTGLHLPVRRGLQVRVAIACARTMLHGSNDRGRVRKLARRLLHGAALRLRLHGDPTPKTNPLA